MEQNTPAHSPVRHSIKAILRNKRNSKHRKARHFEPRRARLSSVETDIIFLGRYDHLTLGECSRQLKGHLTDAQVSSFIYSFLDTVGRPGCLQVPAPSIHLPIHSLSTSIHLPIHLLTHLLSPPILINTRLRICVYFRVFSCIIFFFISGSVVNFVFVLIYYISIN